MTYHSPLLGSTLQVPMSTPGYSSLPASPAGSYAISIPHHSPYSGYAPPSPGHASMSPGFAPTSTAFHPVNTMAPNSPLMQHPSPGLPAPSSPGTYVTYYHPPAPQTMNFRVIPGMPTPVPEIPACDLANLKTAQRMFVELSTSRGQYSCWPLHDLYSWYMLCVFGPFQNQQNTNTNYVWALGRKGVPPLQQEGYRQWVEKSQLYRDRTKEWFQYQFILSCSTFWLYKNYPMSGPAYIAAAFDSTM